MSRLITGVSLVVSIAALTVAVASYLKADEQAQRAVREREQLLIERMNPQLQRIYIDFGVKALPQATPQSVEEMIEPLIRLNSSLDSQPAARRVNR